MCQPSLHKITSSYDNNNNVTIIHINDQGLIANTHLNDHELIANIHFNDHGLIASTHLIDHGLREPSFLKTDADVSKYIALLLNVSDINVKGLFSSGESIYSYFWFLIIATSV